MAELTEQDRERGRKMFAAVEQIQEQAGEGAVEFDLQSNMLEIAEAVRCAQTNYGEKPLPPPMKKTKVREALGQARPSSADPNRKNVKPMKCTKCTYHGEPAHDGKCKECGEPMVPMGSSMEAQEPPQDGQQQQEPQPGNGGPQDMPPGGGAPMMPPPGAPGGPMPPGPPDDGSDDDFEPTDQPDTLSSGEGVVYAKNGRGIAGRVLLVFEGEATVDTGRKDARGRSIVDRVAVSSLSRIPESLLAAPTATVRTTTESVSIPATRVEPRRQTAQTTAQKLIEQVAFGRRSASEAVEALFS